MTELILTTSQIRNGIWHGQITGSTTAPQIRLRCADIPCPTPDISQTDTGWHIKARIPIEAVSEGIQAFTLIDAATDTQIGAFTLTTGEALADDLRAEVAQLRAELDQLKQAFRRHCRDTT